MAMSASSEARNPKPHAVCVPCPANGHINAMLKLAKVLHHKGFHITFVNSEFHHQRFLTTGGKDTLKGLPSFGFETIPDGLPPSDPRDARDAISLHKSTADTCLGPFRELLLRLNHTVSSKVPPVSCIVSDFMMHFTFEAAEELGVPGVSFFPISAIAAFVNHQIVPLMEKGYVPIKDESLDTIIEDLPIIKGMSLRDLPCNINECLESYDLEFVVREYARSQKASGFIINTFEELEYDALKALNSILPSLYAIGPLNLLEKQANNENKDLQELRLSQWKEDIGLLEWLDSKEPNSVVYVSFGSSTFITLDHLAEFSWGLANSSQNFLWILRPNLVRGEEAVLSPDFLESTKERGMVASWCPQEKVLSHNSIGGFLTHSGWNSVMDSISCGVPMICWPHFAEQPTNCWSCCTQWGIGMKINDVKRDVVERLVRELVIGDRGKQMKRRAIEWMNLANDAAKNSSMENLNKLINQVLLPPRRA